MYILDFLYAAKLLILENFCIRSVEKLSVSHAQLNAHIFSCSTTLISFHSLNTPQRVMPGGGTSMKEIAEHGQIKNQFN